MLILLLSTTLFAKSAILCQGYLAAQGLNIDTNFDKALLVLNSRLAVGMTSVETITPGQDGEPAKRDFEILRIRNTSTPVLMRLDDIHHKVCVTVND